MASPEYRESLKATCTAAIDSPTHHTSTRYSNDRMQVAKNILRVLPVYQFPHFFEQLALADGLGDEGVAAGFHGFLPILF